MAVDLLDANVLIDAFRHDAATHAETSAWLQDAIAHQRLFSFPALVEVGFLRIVTHPTILKTPSPLEAAAEFLQNLYASGCFEPAPWTPKMQRHMLRLAKTLNLYGNDVNDVSLAAIAEVMDWRLVSRDQGFARFPKLRWLNLAQLSDA